MFKILGQPWLPSTVIIWNETFNFYLLVWSVHLYFVDTGPIPKKYIGLCFSCSDIVELGGIHKMSQNVLNVLFFFLLDKAVW